LVGTNTVTERFVVGKISVIYMNEKGSVFLPAQYYFWAMFFMVGKSPVIIDL